jgi:hypothetical protein
MKWQGNEIASKCYGKLMKLQIDEMT